MIMRPTLTLLAIFFGLWATALPCNARELLHGDDGATDDLLAPVFQLVSNNSNTSPNPVVPFLYSSLEMDTDASFDSQWKNGTEDDDWRDGNTRWNVSVQFADTSVSRDYTAALHSAACGSLSMATLYIPPGNNALPRAGLNVSNGRANTSLTVPFLIDYDKVEAVAIYEGLQMAGGSYTACVNMVPPAPDFPADWSATTESNFADRGMSFTARQLYSTSLNKARLDLTSFLNNRIVLADFTANSVTFISPANATYPHGRCNTTQIPSFFNWMTDDSNTTLLDTSLFLRFDYSKVQYSPGHEIVRGITCEKWSYDSRFERIGRFAGNFTSTFYFPVNQWRVGREDYHRLLKEVRVVGMLDDGREVHNYFEYVNFKPQNYSKSAAFDVCALAPRGEGCGCTRERIAALNGLQLDSDPDAVNVDNSTGQGQNGNCKLDSGIPGGFVSEQAGPYVGLVIIGMVAGSLFTFLGTWFYYRRYVGVHVSDRVGHEKFGEGTVM